jgi:hypothetical protein
MRFRLDAKCNYLDVDCLGVFQVTQVVDLGALMSINRRYILNAQLLGTVMGLASGGVWW